MAAEASAEPLPSLAREGCAVAICGRDVADLDQTLSDLRALAVPTYGQTAVE